MFVVLTIGMTPICAQPSAVRRVVQGADRSAAQHSWHLPTVRGKIGSGFKACTSYIAHAGESAQRGPRIGLVGSHLSPFLCARKPRKMAIWATANVQKTNVPSPFWCGFIS